MSQIAFTHQFTITIDRADHLVIEQVDTETRQILQVIDFGHNGSPVPVILTWLESEHRDELAPAIDAYLTAEFAKSAS